MAFKKSAGDEDEEYYGQQEDDPSAEEDAADSGEADEAVEPGADDPYAEATGMPDELPDMPEEEPVGAFQSMVDGNMPGPAELNDLLGDGSSFHDSFPPEPYTEGEDRGGSGIDLGDSGSDADYTGQAAYDPEAVKEDVRALLTQKAQERAAASDEFQARAQGMMRQK